ncbi:MAG: argininosuccinate synthase, partial [Deltaproteobacteria bacterium]|nr:argininosuccinate synthase [Deltaproteobacteria bacterium]
MEAHAKIIVAFSGGLDTTYCVAWLKEVTDATVIAVSVDTGGLDPSERDAIAARAEEAGA